ncbi:nucleotidyltransferase domain-containing protein [Trichothermofontia sp.]
MAIDLEQCRESFRQRLALQQAQRETHRQQARNAAIAAILDVAPTYPCITQIYLFGSVTQPGCFSDRSDIDIAVAGTDAATYFALWRDLETACPDWLIDLREINQPCHFSDTVRQTGELIYDASNCYS